MPATPVLDDFNTGATQLLTARTGWSSVGVENSGNLSWRTDAVPTVADSTNTPATAHSNIWNTQMTTDVECWFTYGPGIDDVTLLARMPAPSAGGAATSYGFHVRWNGTGTGLQKNGSDLTTITRAAPVAGETYILQVVGSALLGWLEPAGGGAPTLLLSTSDTAITAAGWIGVSTPAGATASITAFGGGPFTGGVSPARDTHIAIPFTRGAGDSGRI